MSRTNDQIASAANTNGTPRNVTGKHTTDSTGSSQRRVPRAVHESSRATASTDAPISTPNTPGSATNRPMANHFG